MKFHRERKPSPWLVQNLYLRDTWGYTYGLSRPRRFDPRRFFIWAMLAFAVVDVVLAVVFLFAFLFPPRPTLSTAKRSVTRTPTVFARPASPTPEPTQPPPAATRVRPTKSAPTRIATQAPPPAEPTQPAVPVVEKNNVAPGRTFAFDLPATLNVGALNVELPPEPADCTPADQMPEVVGESVKLCAGQTYRPFTLRGENIGVFGDKSAVIQASGRGYGIVAEGARLTIQNVTIRASTDPLDAAVLLCLYPDCKGRPGGVAYGGGILVRAPDTTIMDSDISGGVAGVAAERVRGLKLLNNRLDNATGWGSYNFAVEASIFVGNSLSYANRSCKTPDGGFLPSGCESAGWSCIACQKNIIARNTCTGSGDCYYMNGEGNLTSNHNRFHQNECRAAPHNCYEVTFAVGNEFVENIARDDPDTGAACKYPFWVGGSQVFFSRNYWSCTISPDTAIQHATASTHVPTKVENR
ncbi:MAG: right-handed parallel beta-helix repeat-containing protein [Chloroflexi bacterium]|nr:right-handed parallel beta-helix repeat-containing protein [Chloroflexota bacterium]